MDALTELIKQQVGDGISKSACISSVPCKVVAMHDNEVYTVELISNGTRYTVPNWSGAELLIGENVRLYYQGAVISGKSAYIGASLSKSGATSQISYVAGRGKTRELTEDENNLATIGFSASRTTNVFVVFNANVFGTFAGNYILTVNVDGGNLGYSPKGTTILDGYTMCQFVLPITIESGDHSVSISGHGIGNFTDINTYVFGQSISFNQTFDPTDDSDYIYETSNKTNVIYYIGESTSPEIPVTINNQNTNILRATAFNYSDVSNVYIPDGVTEIE